MCLVIEIGDSLNNNKNLTQRNHFWKPCDSKLGSSLIRLIILINLDYFF